MNNMYLTSKEYMILVKKLTADEIEAALNNLYEAAAQEDIRATYDNLMEFKQMIDRLYNLCDFVPDVIKYEVKKEAKGDV